MSEGAHKSSGSPLALPRDLARILDRVRGRHLAVRVAEFPVWLGIVLALAWVLRAAIDRAFELPWIARAVLLGIDGAIALGLFVYLVAIPLWRRLDRRKAALLVERKLPRLKTSLISAVELSAPEADFPLRSRPLVRHLLEEVSRDLGQTDVAAEVVSSRQLRRRSFGLVAALVVAGAAFFSALPVSGLLVKRVLLSHENFPAETVVVAVSGDLGIDSGADAPLAAKATGLIPDAGKLVVTYDDGRADVVEVPVSRTKPGIFEFTVKNVRQPFRYRFELNDGVGKESQVVVRIPPSLAEIRFIQTYPEYTGLKETVMSPGNLRLLEGSKLVIEGTASEALQSAVLEIKGQEETLPLEIKGDQRSQLRTELKVPARGWKSFSVHLVNAAGEASVNDPVYRVDLYVDKPPAVALSLPKKNLITVLADAKVPLAFKIADDFGLRRAGLRYRVFRPGSGGKPQSAEEGTVPIPFAPEEKSLNRTMEWDLGRLVPPVGTGCVINFWIEAEDNKGGKASAISRSAEKTIAIVSEEEKRAELLELLGERAKDVERLYELQRGMNEKTDSSLR